MDIPRNPTDPPHPAGGAAAGPSDEGRIFIVDDHPVFRMGLISLLRAEGLAPCGEAEDARGALARLPEARADLITVDIALAGGSGLALVKELRSRWPRLPVLALSMHDERLFAERALHAGAIGYLSKSMEPAHLVEGVQRALRGELVISAAITDQLLHRVGHKGGDGGLRGGGGVAAARAGGAVAPSPMARLSDRELEILELMGRGMGTREVAEALHISVKTVETHQGHIKGKLGVRSASELLRVAVSWVVNPDAGRS